MKVVINKCFGGFGLSHRAVMLYAKHAGFPLYPYIGHIDREIYGAKAVVGNADVIHHYSRVPVESLPTDKHGDPAPSSDSYFYEGDIKRDDPVLIRVVEELGEAANGRYAKLKVVEIPDGIKWVIDEYDGQESIHIGVGLRSNGTVESATSRPLRHSDSRNVS